MEHVNTLNAAWLNWFEKLLPQHQQRVARKLMREAKREKKTSTYHAGNGKRERARRVRQGAKYLQLLSHRVGMVQPAHIFGVGK